MVRPLTTADYYKVAYIYINNPDTTTNGDSTVNSQAKQLYNHDRVQKAWC